ncbi:heavy metal translocating P-type ATPase [Caenispirillum bisanense]|uniref:heavy metal translocating P-type ATPase n=1 Tax=Caenispirillum bisanense TaxID=414052 RepID=UPI0031D8D317
MTAQLAECRHCGSPVPPRSPAGPEFCCRGCQAAYSLINGMGLDAYYRRRCIDPDVRPLKPEDEAVVDVSAHVQEEADGRRTLHLMVEGMHCAACVWLIETLLGRQPGVTQARVNMTTRRLTLQWDPAAAPEGAPAALVAPVLQVGYRLVPFDPQALGREGLKAEKELLRAMAVAGFAAGNVMLFSVSVWSGADMGWATRDFLHWISALIAVPAVAYAGRPFYRSALTALRAGRTNMDVPISLGVLLATGMSLFQVATSQHHAYFDASVSLLFFLLIGRYLDHRARGRARSAAEHLLALGSGSVTVLEADGTRRMVPPNRVEPGMTVLVAAGERVGIDGAVAEGVSDIDTSLISGESVPQPVRTGDRVFAGTVNLSGPLRLTVTAVGERTLLAEIVRMMEVAEQGRAKYVALADRVARSYAPVVHLAALLTFLGWLFIADAPWQQALLTSVAVLIITCPCALALAVPVVQVVATGRLLRGGVLVKTATALERLHVCRTIVFDKTGTLTLGKPDLLTDGAAWTTADLDLAASLAGASKHPLARAVAARSAAAVAAGVEEVPGAGLRVGAVRLGSRTFCAVTEAEAAAEPAPPAPGPELWLRRADGSVVRFAFADQLRPDAVETVAALKRRGFTVELLSGDREDAVRAVAEAVGIDRWQAGAAPAQKCERLAALRAEGHVVAMVGDGLNDAPALAAADASISPSTAVDVSQTAADVVFQGVRLAPVVEVFAVAARTDQLVKQNFGLSLLYNCLTIPLAVAGYVTPLIAAVAMSSSSVLVIVNALRLARGRV